jgi:hypothetical protein
VFHVLRWTPTELDHTFDALLERDAIRAVRVKDGEGEQFVSTVCL